MIQYGRGQTASDRECDERETEEIARHFPTDHRAYISMRHAPYVCVCGLFSATCRSLCHGILSADGYQRGNKTKNKSQTIANGMRAYKLAENEECKNSNEICV